MENQGNMQSGKKAAVIYFLAAFFIACIGIAGANYLKGELGLSAETVAEKLGVSPATIYRYENNDIKKFPTEILEPLAKVLHTTPAYLMGWEESATPFPDDQEEIAKVALFGGDGEVTDEMWNEVKGFVEFIKDKRKRENDNN